MDERRARLFRNGTSQAIRIPKEFELPGTVATIANAGDHLVIRPIRPSSLLELLDSMAPLGAEDAFPDIDEALKPLDDPLAGEP